MRKKTNFSGWFCIFLVIISLTSPIRASELPSITVLASSSMADALIEITREYSRKNHVIINLQFSMPLEFVEQIEEGESADLFISEDPTLVQRLKNQGLIDVYSQTNLVENKLALVAKSDHKIDFDSDTDLTKFLLEKGKKKKLALADSIHSTLGKHSQEMLKKFMGDRYYKMPILYVYNPTWIKEIVVEKDKIGVTYFSATVNNPDIKLLRVIEDAQPILYQAAVVAGEHMTPAREYLNYLKSDETTELFEEYGFIKK